MCGRFYIPEDSEIALLCKVMENLESRNVMAIYLSVK